MGEERDKHKWSRAEVLEALVDYLRRGWGLPFGMKDEVEKVKKELGLEDEDTFADFRAKTHLLRGSRRSPTLEELEGDMNLGHHPADEV